MNEQDHDQGHRGGIRPVNAFSNAVDPRKLYPVHFDHLLAELVNTGHAPERWRVLDATETKLRDHHLAVDFTLVSRVGDQVWRRRVVLNAGRLVRIEAC